MLTKGNVKIGLEWRFGPDWPVQRCGAKTRRGTGCQRPANKKNGRCRLHGGASTGAKFNTLLVCSSHSYSYSIMTK